jgi:DNA-directed RNA polymerase specialized sigma24 family protein
VLNRCRDQARRDATARRKLPLLLPGPEPGDEHLWDALQALPFNHRAVVVLRYYHQLPEREIAELLGCRPGSVGPWLQRGLRTLRKALA